MLSTIPFSDSPDSYLLLILNSVASIQKLAASDPAHGRLGALTMCACEAYKCFLRNKAYEPILEEVVFELDRVAVEALSKQIVLEVMGS